MPIRLARYADLEAAARIYTAAFWDEDVLGNQMHPHREQYPSDVLEHWRRVVRAAWWDWAHVFVVATTDGGEVVGLAYWDRRGKALRTRLAIYDPRE